MRQQENRSWPLTVLAGVGLCVLGLVVVFIGWNVFGPGGMVAAGGGSILFGLLAILKGFWHLIRRQ